ncbi:MAG: PHP domain-containing protein [Chloroflexi bacterium]|nr:PHP domain-containing protein [Chloroflexota bacterium]
MLVRADLHVHTVLSPCAEVDMIPPLIVERALDLGLDLIAITDHNSSANAAAVMEAARGSSLKVLPGMELLTREEVHLVCLFDTLEQVRHWQAQVDHAMPDLPNRADRLGEQFVVDAAGDFVRREERMLLVAANIALENAVAGVNAIGGIAIPAHIDRPANGLFAVLGFLPLSLRVDALEISKNISADVARVQYNIPDNIAVIQSSDAHWLEALGSAMTEYEFRDSRNVVELLAALKEKRYQIKDK